jgi:hypothetical protein
MTVSNLLQVDTFIIDVQDSMPDDELSDDRTRARDMYVITPSLVSHAKHEC